MESSLIIATYNWKEALNLVLLSVLDQSVFPGEVIVADDGSRNDTKELIEEYQKKFPVPLLHVWHEDTGFRLSEIRNKAIKTAKGEYLIQVDGDVILHRNFIKDHLRFAQKDCFVTGSRVLLQEDFSKKVLQEKRIRFSCFTKGIKNRFNAIYFPLFNLFSKPKNSPIEEMTTRIRGCNMAFWRKDLIEVNGYDNDFVGWGREDSDIVVRLIKKGCYRKKIKLAALQFHIYHKENSKQNLEENHKLLEKAIQNPNYFVKNGICKE